MMEKKKILVLCTGNSCRSQIAEGYLKHYASERAEVYSAGIEAHGVNPGAIRIMQEDGIDIRSHRSNLIDEYLHMQFDFILTVCDHAKEKCPVFPSSAKRFHQNFPDPAKKIGSQADIDTAFQITRDLIKTYCKDWVANNL
jgi:arsenate reductase (thioredoxin)